MQTHTVLQGNARQTKGIGVAQVLLRCEGQLTHVVERLDVVSRNTGLLKFFLIEFISQTMAHSLFEAFQLVCLNLLARHRLAFRVKIR